MIQWLIGIWRVISSLLFRYEVESLRDSAIGPSSLPSGITLAKDGERSEQRPPSASSSTFPMLNDHICQLYKPNGKPAMEILFFHGLQLEDSTDVYLSTWRTGDDSQQVWPATWLAEVFPDAHIFSISYDASIRMTQEHGRSDLFIVAENLMHDLCSANIGQGFRRPLILVGHSFGGLVMKQLCVDAHHARKISCNPGSEDNQKIGKFLSNVRGLFFYGTPHRGIPGLSKIAGQSLNGPLLDYVEVLSAEAARLESSFGTLCRNFNIWRIASVGELHETSWGAFTGLVVPEASARYGDFSTVGADHFSLCKPAKKTSNSFDRLINFIREVHVEAPFEDVQRLPEVPVGLDLRVEAVQNMLQEKTRVGIFGMGGVGKSTVAKALFNRLGPTFGYSCFCPDVKLMEAQTVKDLKKRILEHMHCDGKKIADKEDGWSKLRGKRLLLVLDDVDHERHVEAFLDIAHVVAAESIFLMTSREKDILKFKLDDSELYEVPFLSENDAKPLFLSHAFPTQARPPPALEKHVDAVVTKCEGLPLTLEVLGSCLRGQQDIKVWEQALDALGKAASVLRLNERLWEKLRVSYNRLEENEQHMFLDATTFFSDRRYGSKRRYRWTLLKAKAAWSVIYGHESLGWKALVDASLVYDVKEDETIKVHEQLLSLGRKIASEDARKGRRVWEGAEGWKLLQSTDESDHQEIHSLRLSRCQSGPFNIPRTSLSRIKKVQYLDVADRALRKISIAGGQENERLQTNLVILRFPDLHFGHIHFDLALPRLAVLELTCYDQQSLPNSIGHLSKLKILSISNAPLLETLPQSFGELSSLTYLEFYNCHNLYSLPESFGGLAALTYLVFVDVDMHSLPDSFGQLSALNHLEIQNCKKLHSLPESVGELSTLNHLNISNCEGLRSLSESFGGLFALSHLHIQNCKKLHILPESFGGLSALSHLVLYLVNLHTLPGSFGELSALNHLQICNCHNLETLPESFGRLSALNHLEIKHCRELLSLPESFGGLSALNHLEIYNCHNLQTLPESFGGLSALNHLQIYHCILLTLPESFGGLSALSHLEINRCDKLHTLPVVLDQLKHLNYLDLSKCWLETFPDSFSQLKALRHLTIKLLPLKSIPDCIKSLPSLQILELGPLPYLKRLPPWFQGQRSSAPPNYWQKFSRTHGGCFVLEDLKQEKSSNKDNWWWWNNLHNNVMDKVRAFDYKGALEVYSVDVEFANHMFWRQFILQERGILKRLMGNLGGALEDLNAALEVYFKRSKDDYGCRKHRGYVKYLLGDISGARADAERALAIWSGRRLGESGGSTNEDSQIEAENFEEQTPRKRISLGEDPITFLDFKLE